jgi:cyanoexosortase A
VRGASGPDPGAVRSRRQPLLFAVAAATAVLQISIASRWSGRSEHLAALVLGWGAALWLMWIDRDPRAYRGGQSLETVLGAAILAVTWAATLAGREGYVLLNRFLPAMAGLGLLLMAAGAHRFWAHWRPFVLLSLTLLSPLPFAIQQLLMPTRLTAAAVTGLIRVLGVPARRADTIIVFPDSTLRVFDACSGLTLMTQVTLLALVVLCFFPTSLRRAAMVLAVAIATGFISNAARVALLGVVASRAPSEFDYWEQYVAGSVLFPVVATALAGALWRVILTTCPPIPRRRVHASIAPDPCGP